jgi:hypothetical protein
VIREVLPILWPFTKAFLNERATLVAVEASYGHCSCTILYGWHQEKSTSQILRLAPEEWNTVSLRTSQRDTSFRAVIGRSA